jgi:hypothetical protein
MLIQAEAFAKSRAGIVGPRRNQSRERAFRSIQISGRRRRGAHTRPRFPKIRLQLERSAKTQRSSFG